MKNFYIFEFVYMAKRIKPYKQRIFIKGLKISLKNNLAKFFFKNYMLPKLITFGSDPSAGTKI